MFRDGAGILESRLEDFSPGEIIARLRRAVLPAEMVPLSDDRQPFLNLTEDTILNYVRFFREFPEALGRLSYALKMALGLANPCPTNFTIKESHFDLNRLEPDLLSSLISLGFEPDHFATLNPSEYEWCFTMKMEIPEGDNHGKRVRQIHDMMLRHSRAAEELSLGYPDIFGYLEMETYSSRTRHVLEFKEIQEEGLAAFPFGPEHFEQIVVPSTDSEAVKQGMALHTHKLIDIHVKVPSEARGPKFAGADSCRMKRLRQLFVSAGFYEILSQAGNHIYTTQLLDARAGKQIFLKLRDWANVHGGIVGIKMESCNYFFRTPRQFGGEARLAPIPNLVSLIG